ncbi:MAG: translation initiation factor IF-1 [Candidatus Nealsonbacteria bacterium RBG_13_37_56]|uniref:Translation initiation factor IF-1 n=1 Tax=Candidatus Nealsonbacteria bacterium RBG_13_37_56 TaxID=1801661 RepID=A0A1G2DUZ1_9BACT|nr:MAG: translation initiation factor IF-1 [Candidatus Nealsonbacteria bacterium RBG_13_37_56]
MKKDRKINQRTGTVIEALPSTHFKVELDDGRKIIAHLAGKLRIYRIKIMPGDRVIVEMSPYDETRGRIVYRNK